MSKILVKAQQQNVYNLNGNGTTSMAYVLRPVRYTTMNAEDIISYCDTVWQQLSLQLDGLSLEWPERPEKPSFIEGVRLTAAHGTMHLQDQKKTELQTFEARRDTVRLAHLSEQTTAMPSTQERKGRKGGCWVVGLALGLLGMVFFIIWKRKTF